MEKAIERITSGAGGLQIRCETGEVASISEWSKRIAGAKGAQIDNVARALRVASKAGSMYRGLRWARVVSKAMCKYCGADGACDCPS